MVGLLMPVGDRLKKFRTAAGLTQQALATKAGLSMSVVSQIEQGTNDDPRLSTLKALAKALGVGLDDLAGIEDEPSEEPRQGRGRPRKPKGNGK